MGTVDFYDPVAKQNIQYNISENLKPTWEKLSRVVIKENDDRVYVVVGQEGSGKSTFVFEQAKFIDPTFDMHRICFTADQFLEQIQTAPKGTVVVFDEAFRGFSSKASQSKVNKILVQAMMEVRRRNLIIFIIIPSIILLEHYIVVHRSNALFSIYKKNTKGKKTWHWKGYNRNKTAEIYEKAKKKFGRFPNVFTSQRGKFWARMFDVDGQKRHLPYETFDEKAYDDKKGIAFGDKKAKESLDESTIRLNELKSKIYSVSVENYPIKGKKELADALGYSSAAIRAWKTLENPLKTPSQAANS
jgi:hypothetical protein